MVVYNQAMKVSAMIRMSDLPATAVEKDAYGLPKRRNWGRYAKTAAVHLTSDEWAKLQGLAETFGTSPQAAAQHIVRMQLLRS